MKTLIAKLEATKEGSRELDAEIYGTISWPNGGWDVVCIIDGDRDLAMIIDRPYGETVVLRKTTGISCTIHTPEHYTTSIDAALGLVPYGFDSGLNDEAPMAFIRDIKAMDLIEVYHPSPALAICIASLRARESA